MDDQHLFQLTQYEIFYASPSKVYQVVVDAPINASLKDALELSLANQLHQNFYTQIPKFSLEEGVFGVFGKIKPLDAILKKGDRIEIYRPLIANPMDARRRRVTKVAKVNVKN